MSIKSHVPFSLSLIKICRLFLVRFGKLPLLKSIIWLPHLHDLFVLILVCHFSSFTQISLLMLQCSRVHLLSSLVYFPLVSLGDVDVIWSIFFYYYYFTLVVFVT